MGDPNTEEVTGNKESRGPKLSRHKRTLMQVNDHLNQRPRNLEDILLLQLSSDDRIEVEVEVLEDAVEAGLVLDDLLDVGNFLDSVIVHEGDVLILEYLFPRGLAVQFLDSHSFTSLCVLRPKEGVPLGLDDALKQSILLHQLILLYAHQNKPSLQPSLPSLGITAISLSDSSLII